MERVKKNEKFWRIWAMDNRFEICEAIDDYGAPCDQLFYMGNYFKTKAGALAMVAKLRRDLIDGKGEESCNPINFMKYLDEHRPEGKMNLSNGECEQIDKAWRNGDWETIFKYIVKYTNNEV